MDAKQGPSSRTSPKPPVPRIYGIVKQEGLVQQNQTLKSVVSPTHPCFARKAQLCSQEVTCSLRRAPTSTHECIHFKQQLPPGSTK